MIDNIVDNIKSIKDVKNIILNLKDDVLENIIKLITIIITYIGIIGFIYWLFSFIFKVGFSSKLTSYVWKNYFNKFLVMPIILLIIVSLILMYIKGIKKKSKILPLVFLGIGCITGLILYIMLTIQYKVDQPKYLMIAKIICFGNIKNARVCAISYSLISITTIVTSLIIAFRRNSKEELKSLFCTSIFSLLILPLVLLLMSNIVAIFIWVAIIVIFIICISTGSSTIPVYHSSPRESNSKKAKENKEKSEENVKEFNGNVTFYRESMLNYGGVEQIKAQYWNGNERVCRAEDFDKGKIIIKLNGKKVTHISKQK